MDSLNLKKIASDAGTLFTRAKQVNANARWEFYRTVFYGITFMIVLNLRFPNLDDIQWYFGRAQRESMKRDTAVTQCECVSWLSLDSLSHAGSWWWMSLSREGFANYP